MTRDFIKRILKERGLSAKTAMQCIFTALSSAETRIALKGPPDMRVESVELPYFNLDGQRIDYARHRLNGEFKGTDGKLAKYLQRAGTSNHLYLPPLFEWRVLAADSTYPLIITEGEFKSAKLCQEGHPCIGVAGVWNWRKRDGEDSAALSDFNQFLWTDRVVYIVFDSDASTNPQVAKARHALGRELYNRRALPYFVDLPHIQGEFKTGVDDWRVAQGRRAKVAFSSLLKEAKSPFVPTIRSTSELSKLKLAEINWIVEGLISTGLCGLYAKPKIGKSFLSLQLAHAVATGSLALGYFRTSKGSALVLALEDTDARIKKRLANLGLPGVDNLHITTSWPKGDDAYVALERHMSRHPDTKLIVVDTLQRFRKASSGRGQNVYEGDYTEMAILKSIADRYSVAIMLIHHMKKNAQSDDVFENVSGSAAITGAADTNIVIERDRSSSEATIHTTGRDIAEESFAAQLKDLSWKIIGPAYEHQISTERVRILDVLAAAGDAPLRLKDIAEAVSDMANKRCSEPNARKMLRGLISEGFVDQLEDKRYRLSDSGRAVRAAAERRAGTSKFSR